MAVLKKSRRSNSNSFSEDNDAIGQRISIQQSSVDSKNIHMNRILCQAYSVDSNISDLSGSIGPNNRPRRANRTQSSDADENIFMSILNDCAALTGISELVSDGQAAITGEATDKKGNKAKRSSRNKSSQPNIWGVSPSNQEDYSDSDDAKPTKSNKKKYEENVQHDNIELVLDDNFVPTPDTAKSSPSKKHLQLKKKVASALNRSSPHLTSSSPPEVTQANRNDVPATSKGVNEGYGPSLLDEIGDDGLGNGGTMASKPISQAKTASSAVGNGHPGSMNSGGKKKSSRKFFGFSSKKKGISFSGKSKRATREQIEEAKKWKSTPDKASGKTYYYNSDTNETKWTKPVGYDEAHEELAFAAESQEGASNHWKATLDASTGKTYYYNKKTKEVSWTIPNGFKGSVRAEKNNKRTAGGGGKDIGGKSEADDVKNWRETVDKTTGKKYYFNKKTKMVSWEKPAGFGTTLKKDNKISDGGTAPLTRSRSAPVSENRLIAQADDNTPFDEEPPDAPFDEPDGVPASPRRAHFDNKNIANAVPLNGRSKSLKSIEFTKQRTYASAMTDTTTKVANTGKPRRDFNSTKINVINDSDEESSKDAAPITSPKRGSQPKQDNATTPSRGTTSQNVGKTPIVSPSSPKRRYRTKKAENLGSDEDSDMDDWSDEVSELSGIGNDEGAKSSRSKHQKDSRTVRKKPRHILTQPFPFDE